MANARLLLVLDETFANELQASFKSLGYEVVGRVPNGRKALEETAKLKPDLMLISIHLSGELGGILIGKQIYVQYDLPVIYISNKSGQATIRRTGGTAPFGYLFNGNLYCVRSLNC